MSSIKYTITTAPTGDPLWKFSDEDCCLEGIHGVLEKFIATYSARIQGWSLSIYNTLSQSTIEIVAPIEEIPKIADYVFRLEHAAPLDFIGLNSLTDSIVIGMPLCKGNFHDGCCYKAENGKLIIQQ